FRLDARKSVRTRPLPPCVAGERDSGTVEQHTGADTSPTPEPKNLVHLPGKPAGVRVDALMAASWESYSPAGQAGRGPVSSHREQTEDPKRRLCEHPVEQPSPNPLGPNLPGKVLYVCGNMDDWDQMVLPRLLQAGAEMRRVGHLDHINTRHPCVES